MACMGGRGTLYTRKTALLNLQKQINQLFVLSAEHSTAYIILYCTGTVSIIVPWSTGLQILSCLQAD